MFQREWKRCPYCREKIRREAIKCRYCGLFLEEEAGGEVCWLCRVLMAISGLILLVGLGVFIWKSGY